MLAEKLRNIFAAKYLPILNRIKGVRIEEKEIAEVDSYPQIRGFAFCITTIDYPDNTYYVVFRETHWGNDRPPITTVSISELVSEWHIAPRDDTGKLSSDDWRRFYGLLNLLVAKLLARIAARRHPSAAYVASKPIVVIYDKDGRWLLSLSVKFTLRKFYIRYKLGDDKEREIIGDIYSEGDPVDIILRVVALLAL